MRRLGAPAGRDGPPRAERRIACATRAPSDAEDAHLDAVLAHGRGGAHADLRRGRRHRRAVRPDGDRGRPPVRRPARSGARRRARPGRAPAAGPCRCPDQEALVRAALSGAVSGGGRLRVLVGGRVRRRPRRPRARRARGVRARRPPGRRAGGAVPAAARGGAAGAVRNALARPGDLPGRRHPGGRAELRLARRASGGEVVCYGDDDARRLDPVSLTGAVAAALTRPMLLPGRPARGARSSSPPSGACMPRSTRRWRATAAGSEHRRSGAAPAREPDTVEMVGRGGVEPPTSRFSGERSYRLSYLPLTGVSTGERP